MTPDADLLLLHGSANWDDAFAELASRYADLVFASALRHVRDNAIAEDVAQAVFIMLSVKAPSLRRDVILSCWLMNATWYASKNALRKDRRRRLHEMRFAMMMDEVATPPIPLEGKEEAAALGRILDHALRSLGTADRSAVIMSYLQGKSLEDVADALNTTREAARKRIERAIRKLRERFATMGVEMTPAAVEAGLIRAASDRAPQTLLKRIKDQPIQTSATAIARGAMVMMGLVQWAPVTCVFLVLAIGGIAAKISLKSPATPASIGYATVNPIQPVAAPSGPRDALAALAKAVRDGDGEQAKRYAFVANPSEQPFVDQAAISIHLTAQFKLVYRAAFGDAAADRLPDIIRPQSVPADAAVTIAGSRAMVKLGQWAIPMIKDGGTWKVPAATVIMENQGNISPATKQGAELVRLNNAVYSQIIQLIQTGQFASGDATMAELHLRLKSAYAQALSVPDERPPSEL